MALPITIPYTFATATSSIPLSQLDSDFTTVVNAINGIGNGTNSLSNVSITGGSIDNVAIGGTTSSTGRFSTVTATTGNITTINATTLNAATHRSDTSLTFQTNGTTTAMTINTSGNVGIGTVSPSSSLDVVGAGQSTASFNTASSLGGAILLGDTGASAGSGGAIVFSAASQSWRFAAIKGLATDGASNTRGDIAFSTRINTTDATLTEAMRIVSSGNVGIGTSSPAYPLDIQANGFAFGWNIRGRSADGISVGRFANNANTETARIKVDSDGTFYINNTSSNTTRMLIDPSGNVGIGTASPSASSILDAQSTTKGVRFPNMTTTQKNAVSSPAAGLVVFDTTLAKLCVYSGSAWQTITST